MQQELRRCAFFFFSSRRRHTRWNCDWSSDVCSSDLRHIAVVHSVGCAGGGTYDHLLHLVRLKWLALLQIFERVEGRLNRTSRCPLLQGREHHPVDYAKLVDQDRKSVV